MTAPAMAGGGGRQLKSEWSDGTTHLVFTPLELLARLASLIPRPRTNLLIYHGILAPNAKLRDRAVRYGRPRESTSMGPSTVATGTDGTEGTGTDGTVGTGTDGTAGTGTDGTVGTGTDGTVGRGTVGTVGTDTTVGTGTDGTAGTGTDGTVGTGTDGTVGTAPMAPWARAAPSAAEIAAANPRPTTCNRWPDLMRRAFGLDVLQCPRCHGRMRLLATIEAPSLVRKILDHLGFPEPSPEASPTPRPSNTSQR